MLIVPQYGNIFHHYWRRWYHANGDSMWKHLSLLLNIYPLIRVQITSSNRAPSLSHLVVPLCPERYRAIIHFMCHVSWLVLCEKCLHDSYACHKRTTYRANGLASIWTKRAKDKCSKDIRYIQDTQNSRYPQQVFMLTINALFCNGSTPGTQAEFGYSRLYLHELHLTKKTLRFWNSFHEFY